MHRSRLIFLFLALGACKKDPPELGTTSAALAPSDNIWAASGVIRVVDSAKKTVVAKTAIGHPITGIVFSKDRSIAWVGTSAGLYRVDVLSNEFTGPLTKSPIRRLEVVGDKVAILEHDVIVGADGTRDIKPFRITTFDPEKNAATDSEEIGQRIHFATEAEGRFFVIAESGEIRIGDRPETLAGGRKLDLRTIVPGPGPYRVRGDVSIRDGHRVFVGIEGQPAHLVTIDLRSGDATATALGTDKALFIRGLAPLPGGQEVFVNAMTEVLIVDLVKGNVKARMALPAAHMGAALGGDGRSVYLAQTVEGTGGGLLAIETQPLALGLHVHLDDISPWAIAVRPVR